MQQSPGHAEQHRLHEGMHSMLHEWHLSSQHFGNASLAIVILLYSAHEPSCASLTLRACQAGLACNAQTRSASAVTVSRVQERAPAVGSYTYLSVLLSAPSCPCRM